MAASGDNAARQFAREVVERLRQAGYTALWAGGCVRDLLLGRTPKDYDVATNARPEQVQKLFRRTLPIGAAFGVIQVRGPHGVNLEVATFRADGAYSDGRHPDSVAYSDAQGDAQRRDFTINGMFYDPVAETVIDYVGGQADLQARVIRAIGDPAERLHEDKLRMLRAVRFTARYGFALEPATAAAIRAMADELPVVSAERIHAELAAMLRDRHRAHALELLADLGLLPPTLPELLDPAGSDQGTGGAASGSLPQRWPELLRVAAQLGETAEFAWVIAALLTFHSVEAAEAGAESLFRRLKAANEERELALWLVQHRDRLTAAEVLPDSVLKPILAHPGAQALLAVKGAVDQVLEGSAADVTFCQSRLAEWQADDLDPPPLVTGHDLIQLGQKPGPAFKARLAWVRRAQLDRLLPDRASALRYLADCLAQSATAGESTERTMPLTLEKYGEFLDRRGDLFPECPPPEPVKAKAAYPALRGIRAVIFGGYGALLRIVDGELFQLHPDQRMRRIALDRVLREFNMWQSMTRKPGEPADQLALMFEDVRDRLKFHTTTPVLPVERVWSGIVDRLNKKSYEWDEDFYGDQVGLSEKIAYFAALVSQGTDVYPEAWSTLQDLRQLGLRIGIHANSECFTPVQLLRALRRQGPVVSFGEFFDPALTVWSHTLGDLVQSERGGKALRQGLLTAGITPDQVLYIGTDAGRDLAFANAQRFQSGLLAADKASLRAHPDQLKDAKTRPSCLFTEFRQIIQPLTAA